MSLRIDMLIDVLKMREKVRQDKIEEAIKIFFELKPLKAEMR